jgi:signal transduction histidine kinase
VGRRVSVRRCLTLGPLLRPRSLFWTFAGVFLLVLGAATALELVVSVTVLRPLAAQRARDRAELAVDRASRQIAAMADPYDLSELQRVLHDDRPGDGGAFLVLSAWDGQIVAERPLAADARGRIIALLVSAGLADSSAVVDSSAAPVAEDAATPYDLIAHRTVTINGDRFGDVAAIGSAPTTGLWALPEARTLLLFLPFAVLASAVAGLIMVRILVGRLRTLEAFAGRVTEGDLAARVQVHGADEIAVLEERFNLMTERLAAARAQLERTDHQRRQLLTDVTHELATPLTSIRGYVETLLDPGVPKTPEERTAYLHEVLEESKRLDRLIAELFELARLEAGAMPLRPERLDWMALCRNMTRRLGPRFAEAGLALSWTGSAEPAWVHADGRRLEQVVENLLVNALRYVPSGGSVTLSLERSGKGFRLSVSDDGPGIAPEDLPHVFERFYRADAARTQGGTGLGLAIVREIVTQHGGTVRAEARELRGATIIVELPGEGFPPG